MISLATFRAKYFDIVTCNILNIDFQTTKWILKLNTLKSKANRIKTFNIKNL